MRSALAVSVFSFVHWMGLQFHGLPFPSILFLLYTFLLNSFLLVPWLLSRQRTLRGGKEVSKIIYIFEMSDRDQLLH